MAPGALRRHPRNPRRTNLGDLRVGNLVNVERSFRVGDEIGGHIVSGHVSGVAR
jgi:riboflavin synthase